VVGGVVGMREWKENLMPSITDFKPCKRYPSADPIRPIGGAIF
jgi:hypothetical protein